MQKPDSETGQACLSYAALTAHSILLPEGVISDALQSLYLLYSDRNVFLSTLKSPSFRAFVLMYCYVRKVIRMNAESSLRSELTISSYFLSSCLGVRVLGSKPNQSSRPGNSNTDSSHHVVLQAFFYKTAKPREATNILEYQNIISTQKWKSAASNQQSHMVRSGKKSTSLYGTQRQEINKVI